MPTPSIEVRNLELPLDASVPRHWHGGSRSVTAFFNALSTFLPPGERFFIASVKDHANFVKDPALREQVRAFCGQEGMHSREHARFNAMVDGHGYPTGELQDRITALLTEVRGHAPPRVQLAITCALEHLTAMMAEMLLLHPEALGEAHPAVAALWRWHAVEEIEHKAVAFDVFLAAGGTHFERWRTMVAATVYFAVLMLQHQVELMRVDGTQRSVREWLELARFLGRATRGLNLLSRYLDYFRADFHPWRHESALLRERCDQERRQLDAGYVSAVGPGPAPAA